MKEEIKIEELNGLTFKKPFRSELELEIYDFFKNIPNLVESFGKTDLTKMTGMEKKALIEKIRNKYNLKKKVDY